LLNALGVQSAAFRVKALFKAMSNDHRMLNAADMRSFFNQAVESTMVAMNAKNRINDIWRAPLHHTAPLKSGYDPNPEAVDRSNWKRRASAANGTSMNILGARRPASLLEQSLCSETFSKRRVEQGLKSLRNSMVRRFEGKNLRAVFDSIDIDQNDEIDRRELKVLLRKMGMLHLFPADVIKGVFDEIDTNGNGVLDFQELSTFLDPTFQHESTKNQNKAAGNHHLVHMHSYNRRAFA
jgi:hypothetical protein